MGDEFDLQDELQALQDLRTYNIPNEHDIHSEDPAPLLEGTVSTVFRARRVTYSVSLGAVEVIAESSDAITNGEVFDIYRSLLKHADAMPGPLMSKLLDSISSGLLAQTEAALRDEHEDQQTVAQHKTPLDMYAFLLTWFVTAAEKVKSTAGEDAPAPPPSRARRGRGGKAVNARTAASKKSTETWSWIDQIPATLALIAKVLRIRTQRIWTTTPERDAFITCVNSYVPRLMSRTQ